MKPAAKKILTQDIPIRLAPRNPKASLSSTPQFQRLGLGKRPPAPPKARPSAAPPVVIPQQPALPPPWYSEKGKDKGKGKGKSMPKARGSDRPSEPAGPPPKAAAERSRSPAAEEESVELDIDIISPTAIIDFERSGVEVYDLETGRSVRILRKSVASFDWLISIVITFWTLAVVVSTWMGVGIRNYSLRSSGRWFACSRSPGEPTSASSCVVFTLRRPDSTSCRPSRTPASPCSARPERTSSGSSCWLAVLLIVAARHLCLSGSRHP